MNVFKGRTAIARWMLAVLIACTATVVIAGVDEDRPAASGPGETRGLDASGRERCEAAEEAGD